MMPPMSRSALTCWAMSQPFSVCVFIWSNSASVSLPGFISSPRGRPILPMSCIWAASTSLRSAAGGRPRSLPITSAAAVGLRHRVAHNQRLGDRLDAVRAAVLPGPAGEDSAEGEQEEGVVLPPRVLVDPAQPQRQLRFRQEDEPDHHRQLRAQTRELVRLVVAPGGEAEHGHDHGRQAVAESLVAGGHPGEPGGERQADGYEGREGRRRQREYERREPAAVFIGQAADAYGAYFFEH